MALPKKMLVEYIGSKEVKGDNVFHTRTVWTGYGDVQEVDEKVGRKLITYKDVWRLADPDLPNVPLIRGEKGTDLQVCLAAFAEMDQNDKTLFNKNGVPKVHAVRLATERMHLEPEFVRKIWIDYAEGKRATMSGYAKRQEPHEFDNYDDDEAVLQAIRRMKEGNPKDYDKNGRPIISRLEEIAGREIEERVVDIIWAEVIDARDQLNKGFA